MRPLAASELIGVWERGLAEHPVERAHALMVAACPESPPEELKLLTVGQRDACLLALRSWTFGPEATGLATCPECGECHELTLPLAELGAISTEEPIENAGLSA